MSSPRPHRPAAVPARGVRVRMRSVLLQWALILGGAYAFLSGVGGSASGGLPPVIDLGASCPRVRPMRWLMLLLLTWFTVRTIRSYVRWGRATGWGVQDGQDGTPREGVARRSLVVVMMVLGLIGPLAPSTMSGPVGALFGVCGLVGPTPTGALEIHGDSIIVTDTLPAGDAELP